MAVGELEDDGPGTDGAVGGARILSFERERGVSFLQDNDYRFAQDRTMITVGMHEARRLAGTLPLLLGRVDGDWRLVGVMGFRGAGNCYLGPRGGWGGTYVPDRLRFYPLWVTPRSAEREQSLLTVAA